MFPDIEGDLIRNRMLLAGVAAHNLIIIFIFDGESNWIVKIFRENFIVGERGTKCFPVLAEGIHKIFVIL